MINVTCAIIRNEDEEVLIVQRGEKTDHPFKWEFPGGKIDQGESEDECIIREIREELSIEIVLRYRLEAVEHDYGTKKIRLLPYVCDTLDELPMLSEHIASRWMHIDELLTADYSEADRIVAENYIRSEGAKPGIASHEEEAGLVDEVDDTQLQAMVNQILRNREVQWLASSALENKAIFNKMLEYSFSADTQMAFRASWILTKICDRDPSVIYPHLPDIVKRLDKIDNESVLRSFLRILSLTDPSVINPKQHGLLAEICFGKLSSGFSAIAIKAYSMEILYKLTLLYPELANELSATLRVLLEDASGGIAARGHQIMKKLAEMPIGPGSTR